MSDRNEKCEKRVQEAFESRMNDLRILFNAPEQRTDELGELYEYGLSFDYVVPGTFNGQREGYWRFQISYGGPSEEFRMYENGEIEFWLLDWFDGACVQVTGEDKAIIDSMWEDFKDEAKRKAVEA